MSRRIWEEGKDANRIEIDENHDDKRLWPEDEKSVIEEWNEEEENEE